MRKTQMIKEKEIIRYKPANHQDAIDAILRLEQKGFSKSVIAKKMRLSESTVRRCIKKHSQMQSNNCHAKISPEEIGRLALAAKNSGIRVSEIAVQTKLSLSYVYKCISRYQKIRLYMKYCEYTRKRQQSF